MKANDDFLRVCEEAARAGGAILQEKAGKAKVWKKGPADLVTEADFASQETVRRIVLGAFPEHCLLGEEKEPEESAKPRAEYRWIVDPLDGTTNFVHGVPQYCVSLALERNGELLVGAIYDPNLDECFSAAKGQGATLNGRRIRVSDVSELSESLAAVGFPPNVQRNHPDMLVFLAMVDRCQAIRRTGSSALNLCFLAAGRFDVYWSYATKIWDVAAGVLIVREAGGLVTSSSGGEFQLEKADFLAAANEKLHGELQEVARKALIPV